MKQSLVTIGIPAYNAERFIGWAIKSVLNQSYKNFELIITDDGSTDKTVEIARSFDDPRIKVISDGENHGISYRLNQQIDLAKGDYFARFDADDIMLPDRIERQLNYMLEHPDVDAIGGAGIVIDDDNKIIGRRGKEKIAVQLTSQCWLKGGCFLHPSVFAKTNYFKKFRYSDELKGVEDRDLWLRSSDEAKLIMLPDLFIFYREPLSFKLKTYMFRRRQNRKQWRSNYVRNKFGTKVCLKVVMMSYIRGIIATTLSAIGQDTIMISRRNRPITKEELKYEPYLRELTKQ